MKNKKERDWSISLFWCCSFFVSALFFGLLGGTVTQLLWGHWKGWLLGAFVLGVWLLMLLVGFLLDYKERRGERNNQKGS